mmetsp:Transcript_51238/g.149064  ORF Transcript_51238/g.149064 Transcript_51238/m.149064 type:complete len:269 (-) Transcript_51238:135-941(-)
MVLSMLLGRASSCPPRNFQGLLAVALEKSGTHLSHSAQAWAPESIRFLWLQWKGRLSAQRSTRFPKMARAPSLGWLRSSSPASLRSSWSGRPLATRSTHHLWSATELSPWWPFSYSGRGCAHRTKHSPKSVKGPWSSAPWSTHRPEPVTEPCPWPLRFSSSPSPLSPRSLYSGRSSQPSKRFPVPAMAQSPLSPWSSCLGRESVQGSTHPPKLAKAPRSSAPKPKHRPEPATELCQWSLRFSCCSGWESSQTSKHFPMPAMAQSPPSP